MDEPKDVDQIETEETTTSRAEYYREYQKRDYVREKRKKYRRAKFASDPEFREKRRAQSREYARRKRERMANDPEYRALVRSRENKARRDRYRREKREEDILARREYKREWAKNKYRNDEEHREREKEKRRAWREKNRERLLAYAKNKYHNDPEYRARKLNRSRKQRSKDIAKPKDRQLPLFSDGELGEGRTLPLTRGECPTFRPCPHYTCRYNLQTHMNRYTFRITEQHDSCALDIADKGRHTLEEVGEYMGITRERVRQIEGIALQKLRAELAHLEDECDDAEYYPWRYWKKQR